ncbi:pyrroloquinoline quinone biosynthesis protein PqqE [Dactylosporangium sp. AC04546]|uniref:pyrroloquinoline quinone biosynthesis protein PqqE n=1 Tax=Dactylosporangium sp. AC04546 TaxID=2862460 RepID=UPI001EE01B4E|nr:pyrroloquinoline quinone biosynthesis protein PqqE [Dactylosporangium sp. AC04546]WVK79138.1 pyrroloquinoline quinone biosynthesis protein PqqE [Dactylosporangium sp. AC04546]
MTPPALRRGVRLAFDPVRSQDALLYPEGVLLLDPVAADVVRACDGRRDLAALVARLARDYDGVQAPDVERLLADLRDRRLLAADGSAAGPERPGGALAGGAAGATTWTGGHPRPTGLLAELTYRCPLRCAYCSNPVELAAYRAELTTAEWTGVFDQARAAGVLQVHLSGGEPLLRPDLADLIGHASGLGMYTNLVTSGIPLTAARLAALLAAGLDHLQLSIQDAEPAAADGMAGGRFHARKLAAAELIRAAGIPLTVNVVLHAGNTDRLTQIAELAVSLGADRLELAHTQYYGWGLRNRAALMPTREQVAASALAAAEVHRRHGERVEIVYVEPDYHTGRPKPCMNGWGSRQLVVAPNGDLLPCLAAGQLGLPIPSARTTGLADAWQHSALFNAFRGTAWMADPCRTCALRDEDLGGCRCQAYQLTGDAAATDPACRLSPHHDRVRAAAGTPARTPAIPRRSR